MGENTGKIMTVNKWLNIYKNFLLFCCSSSLVHLDVAVDSAGAIRSVGFALFLHHPAR